MKSLRIWLLLLLTLLIPVRGAMAAAMLCPVSGEAGHTEVSLAHPGHGHAHDGPEASAGHDHAQHGGAHHDQASADNVTDTFNICSACCSATAVSTISTYVAEPQKVASVFPHLYAPPPSFIPDGQERPPRSI